MKQVTVNPTNDLYSEIQSIAEHFNKVLFGYSLPPTIFALHRGIKTTGYFSPTQWRHASGAQVGEITLNSGYFANQPIIQLFQTLVHEQCHLWQHEFGNPSRKGYHNSEWAQKMLEVGLMPSSTGKVGGRQTGQKMSDYPLQNGKFLTACVDMMENKFPLSWIDLGLKFDTIYDRAMAFELNPQSILEQSLFIPTKDFFSDLQQINLPKNTQLKRKIKYFCSDCKVSVWGKKGLSISCGTCQKFFEEFDQLDLVPDNRIS